MKHTTLRISFALFLGLALSSAAQSQNVLKGAEVTESALIDALAVDAPEGPASDAKTRGFRAVKPGEVAKPANPNAGKASLLVTFPTNSPDLTDDSKALLDTLGRALQSDKLAGFSFRVEGHADPRGDVDRNLQLSQLRAEAVTGYLISNQGLLPERLTAIGKGSSELMNKGRLDAPENRRVTVVTIKN